MGISWGGEVMLCVVSGFVVAMVLGIVAMRLFVGYWAIEGICEEQWKYNKGLSLWERGVVPMFI